MRFLSLASLALLSACQTGASEGVEPNQVFTIDAVAELDEPWAMSFMPDGRALVTEKAGRLLVVARDGKTSSPIAGVPEVDYGGQGGLGDVVLHPDFANNSLIYLSYAEAGEDDTRGAKVVRARLELSDDGGHLSALEAIWQQVPKVTGRGHFGHRMVFDRNGFLFISSGDRQKFDPAQNMASNLGKIVRLNADGSVPASNPFAKQGGVAAEVWSLGHRNPLGLDFDRSGQLWNMEMGPRHGDEFNRVEVGKNYGYPLVSNGDHYSGKSIPDHDTRPDLEAPKAYWVPAISPGGFTFYDGELFSDWRGNAFIGGLSSEALIRVEIQGTLATEAERFAMGKRIRDVEQGPDGALWLLEDGAGGRLLRLTPKLTAP